LRVLRFICSFFLFLFFILLKYETNGHTKVLLHFLLLTLDL
jgi:hypothetical protein